MTKPQSQPGQKKSDAPDKTKQKQSQRQPLNKTLVWIAIMLWPPIALVVLGLLSLLVNYGIPQPDTPPAPASTTFESYGGLGSADTLVPAAAPSWVEVVNVLILVGAGIALLGVIANFAIGIFMFRRKQYRADFF